jgi:hypothetical protein
LKTSIRKTRFLASIKTSKKLVNKFLTLDIETRDIKNKKIPYCICIFDGINTNRFFISDFKNHKDMIINAIQSLMIKKNHNLCIYDHNLLEFDGVYLFSLLSTIKDSTVKPIFKDGKFINIDFILGKIKDRCIKMCKLFLFIKICWFDSNRSSTLSYLLFLILFN